MSASVRSEPIRWASKDVNNEAGRYLDIDTAGGSLLFHRTSRDANMFVSLRVAQRVAVLKTFPIDDHWFQGEVTLLVS